MFRRIFALAVIFSSLNTLAAAAGPYLDQAPPGQQARLFAPGIVSDGLANRDLAMTPDGKEIYWSSNLRNFEVSAILWSRMTADGWSEPRVAPFSTNPSYAFYEPAVSPDGRQFFFVASESGSDSNDIWVMDREGESWGPPRKLDAPVNTPGKEYFPSLTADGTLYFTREGDEPGTEAIYRSRKAEGGYGPPEKLPEQVNCGKSQFNAFVDPQERYIVLPVWGRDDSLGSIDYYVVFRNDNDEWSEPINLGPEINTPGGREYTPYVSPDGKYFFFMSTRSPENGAEPAKRYTREYLEGLHGAPENGLSDIYWIDARVVESLRPEGF